MSVVHRFPYFSYHGERRVPKSSELPLGRLSHLFLSLHPNSGLHLFSKDIMNLWLGPQFRRVESVRASLTALICFSNAFAYVPYTSVQALGRPDLKAKLDLIALSHGIAP